MNPPVVEVKPEQLDELRWRLLDTTESADIATKSEFESFRMMIAGEVIIGYTSGKVVCNGPISEAAVQNALFEIHKGTKDHS
ncbi:MAG: hypothetical protein ACXAAO_07755 [Candidatus Thorarchaeota archaeon]